jgi:integrase
MIAETLKQNRPHLSPSSIKTYVSILGNLYCYVTKKPDPDDEIVEFFVKHPKETLAYLRDRPPERRKTQLAALVVLTEKHPTAELYRKIMLDDARKANDKEKDQEMTESQRANWVTQEELGKIHARLDKDTRSLITKETLMPAEFQRLQNFIILSLYFYQLPRRLQDYTEMKLRDAGEKDNTIEKGSFHFRTYKTAKHHGEEIVKLNPKMKYLLDKWKKINESEWMLVGMTGKKFSSSQLQQRLNAILGRKASVNILRHSYLSEKSRGDGSQPGATGAVHQERVIFIFRTR